MAGYSYSRPKHIIVGFQFDDRYTSYKLNSAQFDHLSLTAIEVRVNGKLYPREPYIVNTSADLTSNDYMRPLLDLQRLNGKTDDYADGTVVDVDNWKDIYQLYCFDISHMDEGIYKNQKKSEIEIRWTLAGAPGGTYTPYCYVSAEREIEFLAAGSELSFTKL